MTPPAVLHIVETYEAAGALLPPAVVRLLIRAAGGAALDGSGVELGPELEIEPVRLAAPAEQRRRSDAARAFLDRHARRSEAERKKVARRVGDLEARALVDGDTAADLRALSLDALGAWLDEHLPAEALARPPASANRPSTDPDASANRPSADPDASANRPSDPGRNPDETRTNPDAAPAGASRAPASPPEEDKDRSGAPLASLPLVSPLASSLPIALSPETTSQATRGAREHARESAHDIAREARARDEASDSEHRSAAAGRAPAREASPRATLEQPSAARAAASVQRPDDFRTDGRTDADDSGRADGRADGRPDGRADAEQLPAAHLAAPAPAARSARRAARSRVASPEPPGDGQGGAEPQDDAPERPDEASTPKRGDRRGWALVDYFAAAFEREYRGAEATFGSTSRKAGRIGIKAHRCQAYDAVMRVCAEAQARDPRRPYEAVTKLAKRAIAAHVRQSGRWMDLAKEASQRVTDALETEHAIARERWQEHERHEGGEATSSPAATMPRAFAEKLRAATETIKRAQNPR